MTRFERFLVMATFLGFVGLAGSGCAPTLASTAVSFVGQKAWEDRTTDDQVIDTKIHTGILDRLASEDKDLALDVSADVWEQRTMITGTVDSLETRAKVEKIARADKRIKAFYNEIKVVSKAVLDQRRKQAESKDDSDQTGFDQWVNDFWLETRIKFNLLTDGDVRSVNFFWRSVLNDVYVIGRARSDFERDSVLANIRATEGVRKIKHHIEVRPIPKKTS